jgi:hypothetical protein
MGLFLCFNSALHVFSAEIRIKPNPTATLFSTSKNISVDLQQQVPLRIPTNPIRITHLFVKPPSTMSQHGFQRQKSGSFRQQDEISQRQVWSLAIGYFAYLIIASMVFYYYSRYADEKHRLEIVEQARGKQQRLTLTSGMKSWMETWRGR